jgi:beta-glucosidase
VHPASDAAEDVAAAWAEDGIRNRWFFDAIQRGVYPIDVLERFTRCHPPIVDGDLETISLPLDFIGINNYSRRVVKADPNRSAVDVHVDGATYTDMGWELYPQGMTEVLLRLHEEYDAPSLYVTENGAAFADTRSHDGRVHDIERIDYLTRYLAAIEAAIAVGVPVRGHFLWSLLDNFEWALGYAKRFGLVFVDYPTLERIPKDSYNWYRDLIAAHRAQHGIRATPALQSWGV